jgi:hypothetical protein
MAKSDKKKNALDQEEYKKLNHVARHYLNLAKRLVEKCDHDILGKTIKYFEEKSLDTYSREEKPILLISAHLTSAAVRLWAIEEMIHQQKKGVLDNRWKLYAEKVNEHRRNLEGDTKLQQDVSRNISTHIDGIIHGVMRNTTGHPEEKNTLSVIGHLTYQEVFDAMNKVSGDIEKDLLISGKN